MHSMRKISHITWFVIVAALIVSLGCNLPFNIKLGEPSATPSPAPTRLAGCKVPDLVGMDAKAAEGALAELGLSSLKTTGFSSGVALGVVSSQQPTAGANLDPCQAEVTIEISLGPAPTPTLAATPTQAVTPTRAVTASPLPATSAPSATKPAVTSTATRPAPSATPEGPKLKDVDLYDQLYFNNFPVRDAYGLLKERWKQVIVRPGSTVSSVSGRLKVAGKMEFYGGGAFQHRVRVAIGGAKFGVGLTEFNVYVDYQDAKNHLRMGCTDTPAAGLTCAWVQVVAGAETKLSNAPLALCTGDCELQIELDQGDIRVYANNIQRMSLKNNTFPTGQIGFSIDAPAAANFSLSRIVVYDIPKDAVAKVAFREDFGGDIALEPTDGQYLATSFTQGDGFIKFKAQAKQGAFYYQTPNNSVYLPATFQVSQSARFLSGAKTAALGLNFQMVDRDNYYVALLNLQGAVQILAKVNGEWQTLLAPTAAAGFKAGEANTLTVKGEGSKYIVQVNGKNAANFTDDRLSNGYFAFSAQLDNPNDQLQVEIYQMEARR